MSEKKSSFLSRFKKKKEKTVDISFQNICRALTSLVKSSEEEFINIGASLNNYSDQSQIIARNSAKVTELITGDRVNQTIENLLSILMHLNNSIDSAAFKIKRRADLLMFIQKIIDDIKANLDEFKKVIKKLSIFGVCTKIESARLGEKQENFIVLAEDVEKLASTINFKFTNILKQLDYLNKIIKDTFNMIYLLRDEQFPKASAILKNNRQNILSLKEIHSVSSVETKEIAVLSDNIARNINEVVTSLQFHDISRQQIEHVIEALLLIEKEYQAESSNGKKSSSDTIKEARHICILQNAQLNHAKKEIINATKQIIFNLTDISRNIHELSSRIQETAGATDESVIMILSDIENSILSLTSFLEQNIQVSQEMSASMNLVARTVGDMGTFIGDIRDISLKIETIAFNALIKSVNTGEEGAPLSVLAQAIQQFSTDTRLQTEIISGILGEVTGSSRELIEGIDLEIEEKNKETSRMITELNLLIESLRGINHEIITLMTNKDVVVEDLANNTKNTVETITVHDYAANIINDTMKEIDKIISFFQEIYTGSSLEINPERLRNLMEKYTMQNERQIHESKAIREHFKDNVELF